MKESYAEGLASYGGPESCVRTREGVSEALAGVRAGRVLSREIDAPCREVWADRGAEAVERRRQAKGNAMQARMSRRSSRAYDVQTALDGIRQTAKGNRDARFTTLLHHVYAVERLEQAYLALKREAAPGVDGQTWTQYGQHLQGNLLDLSDRLARGGYQAQPVRRAYIDKADGSPRPLGVPTLEDKIVQRATVEVLNAIYEQDFLGFSYGF